LALLVPAETTATATPTPKHSKPANGETSPYIEPITTGPLPFKPMERPSTVEHGYLKDLEFGII
jgi:hypothetical protein